MGARFTRLQAMIVKELWALLRDPKARIVLIMPPLIQLFIFSYATTLDVKNIDIGVYSRSQGTVSTQIVERLRGSPNFRKIVPLSSPEELRTAIERRKVIAALVIEPGFDAKVARGGSATLGVVLDGRRSNAAQIVAAYVNAIVLAENAEIQPRIEAMGGTRVTNWYNPALDYVWFTLPSLVVVIVMVSGLAITSQTVARERELGTFEQLMVSPLRVSEILIGKIVPPFIIGFANGTLYLVLAPLVFGVPFTGSLPLFFLSLSVYLLALIGVGLFVSSASQTQQQAFLGSFLVTVPVILLSGYASPIDNMPEWLQTLTYLNPARYFFVIVQGVFLKAMPFSLAWHEIWPMMLIAAFTLTLAGRLFRARME